MSSGSDVVINPLDDSALGILTGVSVVLGIFLEATTSNALDAGQLETCREALRRVDQVVGELVEDE